MNKHLCKHFIFTVVAFFCITAFGVDYTSGLLTESRLLNYSRNATQEAYPDANEIMLDDKIITIYNADGTYTTWDDTAIKVLTEQGRKSNRTLSISYSKAYAKVEFLIVETISEDGKITKHDAKALAHESIDTSQMNSNIYDPDHVVLTINLPELEINDIVRYHVRKEDFKARVPNSFSDYQVFEYDMPIMRTSYEVRAPKSLPLSKIALLSPVGTTVSSSKVENEDAIYYSWTVRDVPQAICEPNMPPLYTCVQRLIVSTIPSWEKLSQWYWNLCLPHMKANEEMKSKVQSLCQGAGGDMDKIRAIFKFVSQEIRYMGDTDEKETPGYEPHDAIRTFSQRNGVCRDKAALLATMLRTAGFEAYPVIIQVGPVKDQEVPTPYFNHAITAVELNGECILMDATDENTAELFPAYLGNRSYLVAHPEGRSLKTSPVPDAESNLMTISTHCDIDQDGTLNGYSFLDFNGINDNAYRSSFATSTPEEIRQMLERILNNAISGAELTRFDLQPKEMQDTETPLKISLSFKVKDFMSGNEDLAFLEYPMLSRKFGMLNFILKNASLDKRRFPYESKYKCGIKEHLTMNFDQAWGEPESLPAYDAIDNGRLEWKREISYLDNLLTVDSQTALKTVQFSAEEYSELKSALQAIETNGAKMPVFNRKARQSALSLAEQQDSVLLEHSTKIHLNSPNCWTREVLVKRLILTYNGLKEYSELELPYKPDIETVTLDTAVVYNEGKVTQLDKSRIKIMDDSWNSAAPRYPQGKILVANFPAVQIGSIIEYKYTYTHKDGQPFDFTQTFRTFCPINSMSVTLTYPESLSLNIHTMQSGIFMPEENGNIKVDEKDGEGQEKIITWTAEEQPPMRSENHLPRLRFLFPSVNVSYGDWKSHAEAVNTMLRMKVSCDETILALAEKLSNMPPLRKVMTIRDFIARNIRSVGPNFASLRLEDLTAAHVTLKDGYGNKADQAILAYSLLQACGLEPEFVLVCPYSLSEESGAELLKQFSPTFFSNVLVRVKAEGTIIWLNDTDQYAELGTSSSEGHYILESNGKIHKLELADNLKSGTEDFYEVLVNEDGSAKVNGTIYFFGVNYESIKRVLAEQTPEERRRFHLELLSKLSLSAKPAGELRSEFDSYPGYLEYSAEVPDFAQVQGNCLYFDIPFAGCDIEAAGSGRVFPYESLGDETSRSEITICLPEKYSEMLYGPKSSTYTFPGYDGHKGKSYCKFAISGSDKLKITATRQISPFLLKPENYKELQKVIRAINHPGCYKAIYGIAE